MPRNRESEEFIKLKKWEESTKTLILARDYDPELQPFSISVVPDELRKWNENAYMPKVVTIGPHYKGATRDLQLMEEIKWDCMLFLFQRSKDQLEYPYNLEAQILNKWMKIILDLDVKVRASYVDEIKLDRYELGTTMLNDGCFLLALLINGSKELNEILESQIEGSKDRGVKLEEGLTDLILLENQIPLFILTRLATKFFPGVFVFRKDDHKEGSVYTIENLVLSFLGLSHDSSFNTILNDHAAHFLEIVYVSIFENSQVQEENQESHIHSETKIIADADGKPQPHDVNVKLYRCATKLEAAGVKITRKTIDIDNKPSGVDIKFNPLTGFNFDIEFNNGKLEIPRMHITERAEARWRNFIAWEHHKMKGKSFANKLAPEKPFSTYKCKCTWAALLFNGLICCASDVQLLKDKKIIQI